MNSVTQPSHINKNGYIAIYLLPYGSKYPWDNIFVNFGIAPHAIFDFGLGRNEFPYTITVS